MANAIVEGAKEKGAEVVLFTASEFSVDKVGEFDSIAFGCPAMGSEQLEEDEFDPMWQSVKDSLGGKRVALFGSYSWADGEWMKLWEEDAEASGVELYCDSIISYEAPDDDGVSALKAMGAKLAE